MDSNTLYEIYEVLEIDHCSPPRDEQLLHWSQHHFFSYRQPGVPTIEEIEARRKQDMSRPIFRRF